MSNMSKKNTRGTPLLLTKEARGKNDQLFNGVHLENLDLNLNSLFLRILVIFMKFHHLSAKLLPLDTFLLV